MCKDYVECPICGKKLMNMTSHIKAHGIEIKDFKIKYPNVDLVSESYSLDIEWDYETLQFEYFTNDGKSHNYYPDFYLRDLDLILEVKPKHEIELEVNQLKFSSVVSCGRNIMYITQDDIVNIDTFKDKIYGVHRLSKTEM